MEISLVKNSGKKYLNLDKEQQLKKACEEFEALFFEMVFKSARKTVPEGGLIKRSMGEEIFTEMFDSQMATSLAEKNSTGLKTILYNQLKGDSFGNKVGKNIPNILA
ncbi:MAG: rod-binding protein [Deferribacterales bacterium]